MALKVTKIVNRVSGYAMDGEELTPAMLDYCERNRELFQFFYQGDVFEPEPPAAPAPEVSLAKGHYEESQLRSMTRVALIELLLSHGLNVDESVDKDDLVAMALDID